MSDFKLIGQQDRSFDFEINEYGDVTKGTEIESVVYVSIFTDRRANDTDEIIGGILMPGDGAADPSGVTHMLAKAARVEGAQIFEKSPVEEILTKNGKIAGVKVNGHEI